MGISLLHALEATGIRLYAEGDQLRAEIPAGVDLAPFREQIATHKPALIRELVQREMVDLATVEPERFDRDRLDDLWRRWEAMPVGSPGMGSVVVELER